MKMIKYAALITAAAMTLTLTACKQGNNVTVENSSDGSSAGTSNSSETFLDKASKFLEADGRGYGKEQSAEIGEVLKNEFFSLKVTDVYRYSSMGDYLPDDGFDFVAVNITVGNIFSESIPVGSYDYVLRWGEGDENSFEAFQVGNLHTDYDIRFFPDDTTLSRGASKSGYVIFQAPSDSTELTLEYLEVYDDDFEGNTYHINLGNPEFAADDIKPEDNSGLENVIYGNIGESVSTKEFDFTVNNITTGNVIDEYSADDGYTYVTADVTLTNTYSTDIEIGSSLFCVFYDEGEGSDLVEYYEYAMDTDALESDSMFATYGTLAPGASVTGTVVFMIPEDSTNIDFVVADLSEDEITVNYYQVHLGELSEMGALGIQL